LAFTVVVGFFSVLLLTLSGEVSSPPAESAGPVLDPATSPPDGSDGLVSEAPDCVLEADEPSDAPDEDDVEDESDGPAPVVSAHTTPGVLAIATPTPRAIASPPTRPM
jgi:hypothetical protein